MPSLVLKLDMMQTLALASVVLFVGYAIRKRVRVLDRYNIPFPAIPEVGITGQEVSDVDLSDIIPVF